MGWFGFNAGSTTGVTGSGGDPFGASGKALALIAVNTNLSACAGAAAAMLTSWWLNARPDIGISINGALGGLVAITAGCAYVSPGSAIVIGGIAGALVVASVLTFERIQVDDPVGAISVHGVCGAWGTLAVAVFHHAGFSALQLASQVIGVAACFVWALGSSLIVFWLLKTTVGLRVSEAGEMEGLDLSEHAVEAYPPDFLLGPPEGTTSGTAESSAFALGANFGNQ